jgi:hypothetical protein
LKKVNVILLIALLSACSTVARKGGSDSREILTERRLWEIHKDISYTYFEYEDGQYRQGLLLNWKPDSILVQPRGEGKPVRIPTEGLRSIRIEVGNRIWEGLAVGSGIAGIYFGLAKSYELSNVSLGEAVWKLFVPPLIVVSSIVVGSGIDKHEEFIVPEDFEFDYDKAKSLYELLE